MNNFKFTILSTFSLICFVSVHCQTSTSSGLQVDLISYNYCRQGSQPVVTTTERLSADDFIALQSSQTTVPTVVPAWLKLVCKKFNCLGKVFKIETCHGYNLVCFFGNSCRKMATKPINWLQKFSPNNVGKVQPWWFPNDRIML